MPKRLLYMVTVPVSARTFLTGQLKALKKYDYEVHVASSPQPVEELLRVADNEGVSAHFVPLVREISIKEDFKALIATWRLMRRIRPDITNVGTPKAGLIGGLASALSGTPARVYTLRGLRLETTSGIRRQLLIWMEQLACASAHRVVCVSPSLRERAVELRLTPPDKAVVLGAGSSNGLDSERFMPTSDLLRRAEEIRTFLNLPAGPPTIGFVGRFVKDKGITELIEAFEMLSIEMPDLRLLLLGRYEEGDPVPSNIRHKIESHPNIICPGFVTDTSPYYYLMDLLAFPTHREGFGNVALEAAAAGIPVVATTATGVIDAVQHGITGLIVPVNNSKALADAIQFLIYEPNTAAAMGNAGRARVQRDFQPQRIWQLLDSLYEELMEEHHARRRKNAQKTRIFIKHITHLVLAISTRVLKHISVHLVSPLIKSKRR
ncbi:glycosyltransferase family 4 protein [Deinococcus sonorensis]|uniref:Glycosyltransferase family 4 protein n=2 Tax=Deinococcus sonorensis TaxID=309891 RepID=A0AAU7UCD8_9DEIO